MGASGSLRMSAKRANKRKPLLPGLEYHRGKWRWRKMIQGVRHTFQLQAATEAAAIAEALALQAQPNLYDLGEWDVEVKSYLREMVALKKMSADNAKNREGSLLRIKGKLGVETPRAATLPLLTTWLAGEIKEHPESSTPATYLNHLKTFFRYLKERGKLASDPTVGLAGPPVQKRLRDRFLYPEQVMELLKAAKEKGDRDLEFIIALGCECGMRRSEIASARPEWFDLRLGVVTIPAEDGRFKRKGREGERRPATIPLSRTVLEIIKRHEILPSPFVVNPEKLWGKWRYRFDFRKRLKNFFLKNGLDDVTIHDMRRTFGSNRVSAGVSLEKVANWQGIDTKTAWERYARFIPADEDINRGTALEETKAVVPAEGDPLQRLRTLKALHAEGMISKEEFQAKRDGILSVL